MFLKRQLKTEGGSVRASPFILVFELSPECMCVTKGEPSGTLF